MVSYVNSVVSAEHCVQLIRSKLLIFACVWKFLEEFFSDLSREDYGTPNLQTRSDICHQS